MRTKEKSPTRQDAGSPNGMIAVIGGFLCALILSFVRVNGRLMPLPPGLLLGAGLAGAEPAGVVGGIVLAACLGTAPDFYAPLVALAYWTVTRVLTLTRGTCGPAARLTVFLLCGAAAMPLHALYGTKEVLYGLVSFVVTVLSGLCFARVFRLTRTAGKQRPVSETDQVFTALSIGMLLISISDVTFSGWSLSVMLTVALAAAAVHIRGFFGAAAGILWTLMLTLYRSCDATLIGSAALGSLLGAAGSRRGKPIVAGAFVLSGLLFGTYRMRVPFSLDAQNLLCGLLLYLLIPRAWLDTAKLCTDEPERLRKAAFETVTRGERRASAELERMGKLLSGFSGTFRVPFEEEDALVRWTIQGALNVCGGCERFKQCWKDAEAMRKAVIRLAAEAEEDRRVSPAEPIDADCPHASALCASVLLSYRQALSRNAVCRRADRQAEFVNRQFEGAGEALCAGAEQMRSRFRGRESGEKRIADRLISSGFSVGSVDLYAAGDTEIVSVSLREPPLNARNAVKREAERACGFPLRNIRTTEDGDSVTFLFERDAKLHASARVFRMRSDGAVSGDATGECRVPGGRVCFALSDGMGRGGAARTESESAIRLLFRLQRAGIRRELICENVNRMLLAQNESETYATLDAVSIDLNTGDAEFLKYGAPPCFLVRGGRVKSIEGEALPCGILAEATPSVIRLRLRKDDRLILCSDGVQDALPEGTAHAIAALNEPDPAESGRRLLALAARNGIADDMTVMVIRVA